jgi:monoamine oxidase
MSSPDFDVIVVGAGAAGLAAFAELDRAGCRVLCLDARDRIGGRILTIRDPLAPLPIELGAEFIHGRPSEIWQVVRSAPLAVYDCADSSVRVRDGVVQGEGDAWESVTRLMKEMREEVGRGREESFSSFLDRSDYPSATKELSASFVEGFNAARKEIIGIASLAQDEESAERIDSDRSFRLLSGYDSVPLHILRGNGNTEPNLRLNTILTKVEWRDRWVNLSTSSALTGDVGRVSATRVIITVPLGVLQAAPGTPGAISWDPFPEQILKAASRLAFGQVVRIVLRFTRAFWEDSSDFADAGFFFSNEGVFPTWWTTLAARAPILTGWSAGSHADTLLGRSSAEVVAQALASLARILNTTSERIGNSLECAYLHDWHADPFSRGAYSYVPAGALPDREKLAEPVGDTLYFAGEAIELNGHSATVHGAIASGIRAAKQILQSTS